MARGDYPSAKQDQFVLRFPDGMREMIKAAAEANNRSMNAEIVARLERSFDTFAPDEKLFSSREIYVWAIAKAHEFRQAGAAAGQTDEDAAWMRDPRSLMVATSTVIASLIRDLLRLPETKPDDVVLMINHAKGRFLTELVRTGRYRLIDRQSGEDLLTPNLNNDGEIREVTDEDKRKFSDV